MSRNDSDGTAGSIVSGSAVISAGIASAAAATITSRFGVAGTLLGTALAAMLVTGGAAILKAYLESATGKVRGVSGRLRARKEQRKAQRYAEPATVPGRPDLRNNPVGRMRAAMEWFSRLPNSGRRSILIKGLIAAAVAFVIGMAVIYGAEKVIGNSFSCGFWSNCPYGATPGVHPFGYGGTGAGPSVKLGGSDAGVSPVGGARNVPFGDSSDGQRSLFGGGRQDPSTASASSSAEPQGDPSTASASPSAEPQAEPSAASASPAAEPRQADPASAPPE